MKKIAIIVCNALNDYEVIIPLYLWKKMGFETHLISIEKKNAILLQSGQKLSCNDLINSVNLSHYDAVYIPGGDGVVHFSFEKWPLKQPEIINRAITNLEKIASSKDKYLFFTNESIKILNQLNLLTDTKIVDEINKIDKPEYVVNFDNIYVTKGYLAINDFCLITAKLLIDKKNIKKIEEIEKLIYYK